MKTKTKHFSSKLWGGIRNKFFAGLLVLAPLGLTVVVLRWLFNFFDNILGDILKEYVEWYFPGLGIILTITAVYIIGLLASNFIGRKSLQYFDELILRLPIVKMVYSTTKGIFQAFSFQRKSNFKKVVFIQYPRLGMWTLGFVTGTTVVEKGEEYHSIFIPSTPVPTTGFVMFLPSKEVIEANFSVEQGLKLLVSGGMLLPKNMNIKEFR
ncbi:DUF502 domain-containing protein [bacterium]|nr:DUF502 domain-containing protein [bacterium]